MNNFTLKRVFALLMSCVLVVTMIPAVAFAGTVNKVEVIKNGDVVKKVTLAEREKVTLNTRSDLSDKADFQWQILADEDSELWVNIADKQESSIELSYALLGSLLNKDSQTAIRCVASIEDTSITSEAVEIIVERTKSSGNIAGTLKSAVSVMSSAKATTLANDTKAADNGDVKKTYDIVINYVFENNNIAADPYTANLAEGSSFNTTVSFPTIQGYLPYVNDKQQNSIELNYSSVSEDVTINVVYKPTNVDYTVIHYQQNVDNDQYTEVERETKQGLTASLVPEVKKDYAGFYALVYERPAIAADGSTVIEVYYDRNYYLINFNMNGGYGSEPIYARYGAEVGKVTEPTKAGYIFSGWAETEGGDVAVKLPESVPAGNKTYYAIWTPNDTAKVTVVFWGENADDEEYSYLADKTKVINLKPGKEFTYSEDKMLVCDKDVHTHSDACKAWSCTLEEHTHSDACCTHTHDLTCYSTTGNFILDSNHGGKTESEMENLGNGLYKYSTGLTGRNKHYYVKIGDNWYCSSEGNKNEISFKCSHTSHDANCCADKKEEHRHSLENGCFKYTCGKEEHSHDSDCYMQGAGLESDKWVFVKSDTITVAADGSSVVNVYYDRVQKTLTFKYSYNRNSYSKTETITAKWGENIDSEYNAIVKNAGSTFWSANSNYSGPYTNYFGVMPDKDKTYYYQSDNGSNGTMYYYGENLNGEYVQMFSVSNVGGYTVTEEDHYEFKGFSYDHGTSSGSSCSGAKFYYTRNSYKLTFNDGYSDVKTESVKYEAPLSTYGDYVPEVPSAYEPGSVEFGGWYQNPQCTGEEYKLDTHKMPANDLILYAKWIPVTHKVNFYLNSDAFAAGTKLESHPTLTVEHGELAKPTPKDPENGSYIFVGWFYMDNSVEKAFDFDNMQVRKDLDVYAKWSSNTLKEYTVQYVLKSDHSIKVADDRTGSGLAGTTKTFDAKGGTELYKDYQEGYFPTVQSQSLLLDIDEEALTITFEYVPMPAVPYTVKYVEKNTGESLADEKVVSDNRKAVVTETFKPISGYMPDAYQKRLVVTADGENVLYFYYTKDTEHAYYKVTHYTQNTDGKTWSEYASSQIIGDIGTRYTASPMTIPGFTYKEIKYVVNETEVSDVTDSGAKLTEDGLEINLYYVRNEYPYQVRYLEQGSGKVLHAPKDGTGIYGQIISESAIDIDGYDKVDPTSATLDIKIEEGKDAKLNVITFYYKEQEVKIDYKVAGGIGGTLSKATENLKVLTGIATGSTAEASDYYEFKGWYSDVECKNLITTELHFTPEKVNGKNVEATYYAKFNEKSTIINYKVVGPDGCGTVNPGSEEVKYLTEEAKGSTAEASSAAYKFVGWYDNEACNGEAISTDAKYVPTKEDGKAWKDGLVYYAKFEYNLTSLTIKKTGVDEELDAGQTFVFNVKGISDNNQHVNMTVMVCGNGSVTIDSLLVGKYEVTEDTNWSWRYTPDATTKEVDAKGGQTNEVTFNNTRQNNKWLDSASSAVNVFKKLVGKGANK